MSNTSLSGYFKRVLICVSGLMAIGLGEIDSLDEVKQMVRVVRSYEPDPANAAVYDKLFVTFKNLYKANKKNFREIV